jgi:hypothetical protein
MAKYSELKRMTKEAVVAYYSGVPGGIDVNHENLKQKPDSEAAVLTRYSLEGAE